MKKIISLLLITLLLSFSISGCSLAKQLYKCEGKMKIERADHTATLLKDGRILITGGKNHNEADRYPASAEIFDPVTLKSHKTGKRNVSRMFASAVLLNDGRVLITGGMNFLNLKQNYTVF
ncbi:MAG: kelch repeat-containing protein [bacterium]